MLTMVITVTKLSFVYIVPHCYRDDDWSIFRHRAAMLYIFVSLVGSFFTCIFTDAEAGQKLKSDQNRKFNILQGDSKKNHETNSNLRRRNKKYPSNGKLSKGLPVMEDVKLCSFCEKEVPERSHHCILCEKCVYKRDHHCFFMGVCIGYNNQKYFIYFVLFMAVGTLYGLLMIVQYMNFLFGVTFYGPQTFVTIFYETIFSLLAGKGPSLKFLFLMILMNGSLFATLFSFGFLYWQMQIVLRGQTTYEFNNGIDKYSKASKLANFRDCFGRWWIMSLCIPFVDLVR